jgi:hypothetical protein
VDVKRLVDLWVTQCNAVRTVKVDLDTRLVEGSRLGVFGFLLIFGFYRIGCLTLI